MHKGCFCLNKDTTLNEGPLPSLDFGDLSSLIQLLLGAFEATVGYFAAARTDRYIK